MTLKDDLTDDVALSLLMSLGTTDTDYKHYEKGTGPLNYWLLEARAVVYYLLDGWDITEKDTGLSVT